MTTITAKVSTDLNLDKRLARKLGADALMKNKRATEVSVSGFNKVVVYSYKGQRADREAIEKSLVVERSFDK